MTVTPTRFASIQLTNASVDMYTAPANTRAVIKRLAVTNITAGAITVTVTLTPSGGSALTVTSAFSVAAGVSAVLNEWANMVLSPGDKFSALASANTSINLVASGFVVA